MDDRVDAGHDPLGAICGGAPTSPASALARSMKSAALFITSARLGSAEAAEIAKGK